MAHSDGSVAEVVVEQLHLWGYLNFLRVVLVLPEGTEVEQKQSDPVNFLPHAAADCCLPWLLQMPERL